VNQAETSEDTQQPDDSTSETLSVEAPSTTISEPAADDSAAAAPEPAAPPAPPPPAPAPPKKPAVDSATGETGKMDWYILKVAFNREDSIADALRKRVNMEGMLEFFGEIVVPTEDVATFSRDGKRRVSKRKLLPGYIMVNMIINDDTWFLVRETNGISDFTGAAGKPMPMEPSDIERFVTKPDLDEEEEAPIKIGIPFNVGDRVRVKEGNFENQEGEVDGVDEANGRVTVIINIFGRSVPMELDHWQVEPL
jgi:transcriptional antiterminator NusG